MTTPTTDSGVTPGYPTSADEMTPLARLSTDLARAVDHAAAAVVTVHARHRLPSTGVLWRAGIVVTADHTVERDDEITVTLPDGQTLPATLAGRDPTTDLAVLRVEGANIAPAALNTNDDLKVGQLVLALGRPGRDEFSASFGVISAASGAWRTMRGGQVDRFIRPDLTLYPGYSGGPLVDAAGQIVGINTSQLTRSGNVTIPVSTVNTILDQLLAKGRISRGYLGLAMQPVRLPEHVRTALGLEQEFGLIAVEVAQDGPAAQGGLYIGDILLSLADQPVTSTDAIQSLLTPDKIGTPLVVQILRAGALTTLTFTVGERA